ncbi:hypothetical protein LCGC14_2121760 [marine sediment metagenome]|uniref:Uncharacterized protein n=1 Tax=marine sediment metagenome TaxID=412755 RepID=A0A0F9E436_9ZZZZ
MITREQELVIEAVAAYNIAEETAFKDTIRGYLFRIFLLQQKKSAINAEISQIKDISAQIKLKLIDVNILE